jgi:hypothetical protein
METIISKLQVQRADKRSVSLVDENSISFMFQKEPHFMNTVVTAALAKSSTKSPLDVIIELTKGSKRRMSIGNRQYQWDLLLRADNSFTVVKSGLDLQSGFTTLGNGGQEFLVGFGEECFTPGDIVTPEDERYQLQVKRFYMDGGNYVYAFVVSDPSILSIPVDFAEVGQRWTRRFTPVAENSDRGGHGQISRGIKLRNSLTTLRTSYSVTRSARQSYAQQAMTIAIPDPENPTKTTTYWTDYVNWQQMVTWSMDRAYAALESKTNEGVNLDRIIKDDAGRNVYMGAGILDQISPSNIFYYSNGTLVYEQIEEWATQCALQVTSYGTQCELTLFAGLGLRKAIDTAVSQYYGSAVPANILTTGATFLEGKGNDLTHYTTMFSKLVLRNGNVLNIVAMEMFNDPYYYKKPAKGMGSYTQKSFEGFILNLGASDTNGGGNLIKVFREGAENIMWTVAGSIDETGKASKSSATSRDGYEIHTLSEEGVYIPDPVGSARIIMM